MTLTAGFVGCGKFEFYNSVNEGYIEGVKSAAGFIAVADGDGIIENCTNSGNIVSKEEYAAGFVIRTTFDNRKVIIKKSSSVGQVNGALQSSKYACFNSEIIDCE